MITSPSPRIRLPVGVRDFLPQAAARRRAIAERLLGEFERWGFERIITPLFECADVLERGLGADARAAAIRFVEPVTGEVVALRPDITPQVARLVATRLAEAGGPVRLCYEGAVARLATGARGQREILQAGVELYGALARRRRRGGLGGRRRAGRRLPAGGPPRGRSRGAGPPRPRRDRRRGARAAVGVSLLRKDRAGVVRGRRRTAGALRLLLEALPGLYGEPRAVLAEARALRLPGAVRRAVDSLEEVLASLDDVALPRRRSISARCAASTTTPASGWPVSCRAPARRCWPAAATTSWQRYGRPVRAVGFAIDVEAIAEAQSTAGVPMPARADGILVAAPRARRREAGKLAAALRAAGNGARRSTSARPARAGRSTTTPPAPASRGARARAARRLLDRRAWGGARDRRRRPAPRAGRRRWPDWRGG